MADDDDKIELVVGGIRYDGWKSVRVTRTIEALAGQFALEVSDKWGEGAPWPIMDEDPCRVDINGLTAIDGYVDARNPNAGATTRQLSYTGRDKAAALVDCSIVLTRWTFRKLTLLDFARKIAEPFGVKVSLQAGLALKTRNKIVVSPGDKVYEAIAREAKEDGVMLVSDGAGGILITRSGTARATSLVEGKNILSAVVNYDGTERFYRYIVATQAPGTDEAHGAVTKVLGEAFDEGVRRKDRVLYIKPDKSYNAADARRRADWEARTRAARSESVTILVQGWTQPDGAQWPLNVLTRVRAPRMVQVDGDMLISQVENTIADKQGKVTQLKLVRPDAFMPEPTAKVKASGGVWKQQIEKGKF